MICSDVCLRKVIIIFFFSLSLSLLTFKLFQWYHFENSTPLVFGIHRKQDDLNKMLVAAAGVVMIVDSVD